MKEKFEDNEQLKLMSEMLARYMMTKQEIMSTFNFVDERPARRCVEKIARELPVISTSKRAGYKVATELDSIEDIKLADKELELKIKALRARRKPLLRELKRRGA